MVIISSFLVCPREDRVYQDLAVARRRLLAQREVSTVTNGPFMCIIYDKRAIALIHQQVLPWSVFCTFELTPTSSSLPHPLLFPTHLSHLSSPSPSSLPLPPPSSTLLPTQSPQAPVEARKTTTDSKRGRSLALPSPESRSETSRRSSKRRSIFPLPREESWQRS